MKASSNLNRRQFLKQSGALAVATAALPRVMSGATSDKTGAWKFCAFDKPLQFLSYEETADFVAELGYSGIEATVRPGGHVLPERVEEDLPKLVEALKKRDLEITILTSGINSVRQLHTERVLRTAAKLGIQRYRMLWWRYDLQQPIWPQMEALRPVLKDLVALHREVGISGLYQNHAGANMVGASLWDIYGLIKDYDPKDIGLAYDIRHAQVEAALAWPAQLQLVQSHVAAVCVKDYDWDKGRVRTVPLGAGRVDSKVVVQLRDSGFAGPLSVHVEYDGGSRDRKFLRDAFRNDLETLKEWLERT